MSIRNYKSKEKIECRYDKRIGENTSNFSFSFSQ